MSRSVKYTVIRGISFLGAGFIFVALNFLPETARSQEVKHLTLKETIDLSLKHSYLLKASLARNEQAEAELKQATDARLPSASVSGSYLFMTNPSLSLKTGESGGGTDSSGNKNTIPHINQAMYGILNVSLPIYAGGKIRYGIQSAQYLQQAAALDADKDKEAVALNAIDAYINLYKASVTVKVVRENLSQSTHQDSVFARLEANGLMAKNDLLKSELQTSNIGLSLLDAESNLKMANVNMDLMLGYPDTTLLLIDSTVFDHPIDLKTLEDYEQLAVQQRKDLTALSFREKAATTGIAVAKADQYPSIALTGGYIAANIPHLLTLTNAVNVGIGLKYPISSIWNSRAKIEEAKSREKEIIANKALLGDQIRLQVNQEFENYLLSRKKEEVYKKAVVQAEENYRITKNKYDNSLVIMGDLLDANVLLLQSRINLAVARADELLTYSRLLNSAGILSNNE